MAGRRVPALAFLAAFLVAFNVFSSHGADRPSPRRALGDLGTDAMAHVDGSSRGSLMDAVGHVGGLGGWTRERGVFEELAARARYEGHPLDSRDPDVVVDANGRRRKRVVKRIIRKVRRKADGTTEVISEKEEHPTDVITNAHKASEGRGQRGEARTADAVSDADKVARARSSGLKIETRRVGNVLEPFVPAIAAADDATDAAADADADAAPPPKETKASKSWFGSSRRKRKKSDPTPAARHRIRHQIRRGTRTRVARSTPSTAATS